MKHTVWRTILCAITAFWFIAGSVFAVETTRFTFVTISDIHIPDYGFSIGQPLDEASLLPLHNQQNIKKMVRECLVMDPKPSFVINCGDTVDNGWTPLLTLYRKLMQPLVAAGMPVYTVVGNHDLDYAGIAAQDLAEIFEPLGPASIGRHGTRYSFDYHGCHFVILNDRPISGLIRLNPEDISWFRHDLKAVKKDTRILLFMHADLPVEDTHHIVELLQPFRYPVIFQGHAHEESIGKWGGVPVVVTGSLYGGNPKAGSYRIVTVSPDRITVRTRDFADPEGAFGPETAIEFPPPGPNVRIIEPREGASRSGNLAITVATDAQSSGVMEYSIPGFAKWTPMTLSDGKWRASATLPDVPGRYLLTIQFKGQNGAVTLAHRTFIITGEAVREAWSRDLGSAVQGAPVIWHDSVIVPSIEGGVYALRLKDGATVWRCPADGGQIVGRMAIEGDRVFYGAGRSIYALDAKTGKPLWRTIVEGTVIAGLTVQDGKLFAPAGEHALVCLDIRDGKQLWSYPMRLPIIMEATAANGRVFFGAMDGFVRALDAATGKAVWENRISAPEDNYTTAPFWPPAALGDNVVISKLQSDKDNMNIMALPMSDGARAWSRQISGAPLRPVANLEHDKLFALFPRGLQCMNSADGDSLWSRTVGVGMYAGIAVRDRLFFRDGERLCCVDASTGEARWIYKTSTGPQGSYYGPGAFAVTDSLVVVGTMDGRVMALKGR